MTADVLLPIPDQPIEESTVHPFLQVLVHAGICEKNVFPCWFNIRYGYWRRLESDERVDRFVLADAAFTRRVEYLFWRRPGKEPAKVFRHSGIQGWVELDPSASVTVDADRLRTALEELHRSP